MEPPYCVAVARQNQFFVQTEKTFRITVRVKRLFAKSFGLFTCGLGRIFGKEGMKEEKVFRKKGYVGRKDERNEGGGGYRKEGREGMFRKD